MVTVLKRMSRLIFVSMTLWGVVVTNVCALDKMASQQFLSSAQLCGNPIRSFCPVTDITSSDVANCHAFAQLSLASVEKLMLPGEQNSTFEQSALQARALGQTIDKGIPEKNPYCFSHQMTLDDIATKINSEVALGNQKGFWSSAVLIKLNRNAKDILAVVLDKPFSSK